MLSTTSDLSTLTVTILLSSGLPLPVDFLLPFIEDFLFLKRGDSTAVADFLIGRANVDFTLGLLTLTLFDDCFGESRLTFLLGLDLLVDYLSDFYSCFVPLL